MSSNATISKQAGRRYRTFSSTASIGARPFASVGNGATVTLVYGPLMFHAADIYRPGAMDGGTYLPGAKAADIYRPGAKAGTVE